MPRRNVPIAAAVLLMAVVGAAAGCSPGTATLQPEPSRSASDPSPSGPGATPSPSQPPREATGAEPAPASRLMRTVGEVGSPLLPATGAASGAAIPRYSPNGHPLAYWDDFTAPALSSQWSKYNAIPRSSPQGLWRPSQVFVKNGRLVLRAVPQGKTWVTGGVMNYTSASKRYGSYLVRFRAGKATGIKYAILLWPQSDNWPVDGEIDIAEDGGGKRTGTTATLHFGAGDQKIQRQVSGDFSAWHTVGVEWSKGLLSFVVDGRIWATISDPHVPDGVMNLAIQTESVACGETWGACPNSSTPKTVDFEIDWVAVYSAQ